jgi:hypothetical protein
MLRSRGYIVKGERVADDEPPNIPLREVSQGRDTVDQAVQNIRYPRCRNAFSRSPLDGVPSVGFDHQTIRRDLTDHVLHGVIRRGVGADAEKTILLRVSGKKHGPGIPVDEKRAGIRPDQFRDLLLIALCMQYNG